MFFASSYLSAHVMLFFTMKIEVQFSYSRIMIFYNHKGHTAFVDFLSFLLEYAK